MYVHTQTGIYEITYIIVYIYKYYKYFIIYMYNVDCNMVQGISRARFVCRSVLPGKSTHSCLDIVLWS